VALRLAQHGLGELVPPLQCRHSKSVVGFLKLPFPSLSARRRFELPIRFQQHPFALCLELVPVPFQDFEPVEGRPEIPLDRCELLEHFS